MVLTAYSTLSPAIGLVVTVVWRNAEALARNLTPASRRQDHVASPSATGALVARAIASTASSAPRLVTIAKRPSSRAEDARKFARDLPDVTSETICGRLARRANQVR